MKKTLPHCITSDKKIILFDSVCKLCNTWSRFIIQYDKEHVFQLASVQSPEGQAILRFFKMPTESFDTMLYVEGEKKYEKSDAFLRIMIQLKQPWKSIAIIFRVLPAGIRDWMYDRIALNRYSLFGKYDQCMLPTPDHKARFFSIE